MKRLILIFVLVVLCGCSNLEDKKQCETASDCEIMYNVKYEGNCQAGCFNTDAEVDEGCSKRFKWEILAGGCTCEENRCAPIEY